jgi:hypothetical protein
VSAAYAGGRYQVIEDIGPNSVVCHDQNLDRRVCIHWVATADKREVVRSRLAALQSVHSPYLALIYDFVDEGGSVGVVEEALDSAVVTTDSNALRCLYEFCAGLAALHANYLAHGALDEHSFRVGPLGRGRLCNLAFGDDQLDDPATDREAFAARLMGMGADQIPDETFQHLREELATPGNSAPTAQAFRARLAALLLRDQHRALAHWQGKSIELGVETRSARFRHPIQGVASVKLEYDGTRFFVAEVNGEVRVNNRTPSPGEELPGSCVIVLGSRHRPWHDRYPITFDQSHPEVA